MVDSRNCLLLADEEVEDFRRRLRLTLENQTTARPPIELAGTSIELAGTSIELAGTSIELAGTSIEPAGTSIERKYNEQEMAKALTRFVSERASSFEWLRSIKNPVGTARTCIRSLVRFELAK